MSVILKTNVFPCVIFVILFKSNGRKKKPNQTRSLSKERFNLTFFQHFFLTFLVFFRDNFFSLVLLLFRVGNQRLREYFKTQWPIVYRRVKPGTVPPPWQDTPHDAKEMKKIQPTQTELQVSKMKKPSLMTGNTNVWDLSLLTTVLKYSSLEFVHAFQS